MANYPDWVLKHKKKGTYINKSGNNYYLYSAHSERVKGTNKVKRIFDEYLGKISEKDGLIPPKDKVKDEVIVLEFGLSFAVLSICNKIHAALRKSFVKNGDLIMSAAILNYIYGLYSKELFESSYLSLHFLDIEFPDSLNDTQKLGVERGTRMIADTMKRSLTLDLDIAKAHFSLLSLAKINDKYYLPKPDKSAALLAKKYSISWEDATWPQK